MCKRKSPSSELREPSIPTSPPPPPLEVVESSSAELPDQFSWSSSSSSVSYSSKITIEDEDNVQRANATPPETRAMPLVGCPRCFMYVMLSEADPKCPKCKSTVFLEFFKDENFKPDN